MEAVSNYGMTETFYDVENLMYDTINQFRRSYPYAGDAEELLSQSQQIFMRAYRTHLPSMGKFSSWFRFLQWKILLENVRRNAMRNARMTRVDVEEMDSLGTTPLPRFNLEEFAEELACDLSEDAKTVMRLTVDAPMEVLIALEQRGGKMNPRSVKASLREFLKDVGWTTERVTESFTEITKALR